MADVLGRTVQRVGDPVNAGVHGAGLLGWLALGELAAEDLHGRAAVAAVHEPRSEHARTYDKSVRGVPRPCKANRSEAQGAPS